jgi:hypothetical protein
VQEARHAATSASPLGPVRERDGISLSAIDATPIVDGLESLI